MLHCHCGFEARAADEGGLVAEVRLHAWEAHGMALSDDEALVLAFRAGLDNEGSVLIPCNPNSHSREEER